MGICTLMRMWLLYSHSRHRFAMAIFYAVSHDMQVFWGKTFAILCTALRNFCVVSHMRFDVIAKEVSAIRILLAKAAQWRCRNLPSAYRLRLGDTILWSLAHWIVSITIGTLAKVSIIAKFLRFNLNYSYKKCEKAVMCSL